MNGYYHKTFVWCVEHLGQTRRADLLCAHSAASVIIHIVWMYGWRKWSCRRDGAVLNVPSVKGAETRMMKPTSYSVMNVTSLSIYTAWIPHSSRCLKEHGNASGEYCQGTCRFITGLFNNDWYKIVIHFKSIWCLCMFWWVLIIYPIPGTPRKIPSTFRNGHFLYSRPLKKTFLYETWSYKFVWLSF